MSTDNLSKMITLAELRGFAQGKGLDLKQAPKIAVDDDTGRRRMRRWIRDMIASQPVTVTEEQVAEAPVEQAEELETPQQETVEPIVEPVVEPVVETTPVVEPEPEPLPEPEQTPVVPVVEPIAEAPVEQAEELETPQQETVEPIVEPVVEPVVETTPVVEPEPVVVEPEPEPTKSKNWLWWVIGGILLVVAVVFLVRSCNGTTPVVTNATATARTTIAPTKTTIASTVIATAIPTMAVQPTAAVNPTAEPVVKDGKMLAEQIWGEPLPDQPEIYSAHLGEEGFPEICSGLCWDTSKLDQGIMMYYGPWNGEEDITQSDAPFGNGDPGPLDLMRSGMVTKVIFYLGKEAQLEVCAIGTLDGKPLTEVLGINKGQCGKRVALSAGWHVIQGNSNTPIAGFGIRFTASGWAGMSESQIVEYTKYWTISGDTATWVGPEGVEIMMTPSMVQMMQDFGILKNVVFTTKTPGKVLFCNGTVSGSATLTSPDGACHMYEVPAGTFTYTGEARLSAGIGWQPAK